MRRHYRNHRGGAPMSTEPLLHPSARVRPGNVATGPLLQGASRLDRQGRRSEMDVAISDSDDARSDT